MILALKRAVSIILHPDKARQKNLDPAVFKNFNNASDIVLDELEASNSSLGGMELMYQQIVYRMPVHFAIRAVGAPQHDRLFFGAVVG